MKYEINGFDDVFVNKNLIQLRKVPWFLREANLESWVVWVRWSQLNFAYHYCVSGAFASVYAEPYVIKVEVYYRWILLCIWSFLSFFFPHQYLSVAGVCVNYDSQLAISFQTDTIQSPKNVSFWYKSKVWYEC